MTPEECVEELAPAVVVRAALFPLRTLLRLADAELVAVTAGVGKRATPAFDREYEASLELQQRMLAAATVDDPRFARALCFTNEELSRRLASKREPPLRRNKRARHRDTTLYRYLARAVWRREPCDLWAGVALGAWGPETRVGARPARYALSPDLSPYQLMIQTLARSPAYVARGVYKLNPTLRFDAERPRWLYTDRVFGSIVSREWPSRPGVDALLRAIARLRPATLAGLAAELRRLGATEEALDELLSALQSLGLLVGGLLFPRAFRSAWDALLAVLPDLLPEHARAWRSSVIQLRRCCRRIERRIETSGVAELHAALSEVRAIPVALARALSLEPPKLPRSILRCDTRLPFSITLGPEVKARVAAAVAEFDLYERFHGVDLALRAAHRALMVKSPRARPSARRGEPGRVRSQESVCREVGAGPVLAARLEKWSGWIRRGGPAPERREGAEELYPPPIGGLILRVRAEGFAITGSTTEIAAAYGRFGALWYRLGQGARHAFAGHPLHEWYTRTLARVARQADVEVVEYVGPCEGMPNALARPRFPFPAWDRWAPAAPFSADQLTVEAANPARVPFATRGGERFSITCFAPVNLGFSEPYLESLLLSSFREIPAWLPPGLPMQSELESERPTPALALASGNTVRSRRTLLRGAPLAELVAAGRATRFLLWQALAREHAWPPFVLVSRDGEPPLPVVRDSPLALEAALEGLRDGVAFLSVEEPDEDTWLVNDHGEAFVSEIIVPFLRRRHAWSDLAAG